MAINAGRLPSPLHHQHLHPHRMISLWLLLLCTPTCGGQVSGRVPDGLHPRETEKKHIQHFQHLNGRWALLLSLLPKGGIPQTPEWDSELRSQKVKICTP